MPLLSLESRRSQAGLNPPFKFTSQGKVTRVLPDGRVAWLPGGRKNELLAVPESLIKLKPGKTPDLRP